MDDRALNSKKAKVHRNGNYIEIKWDEVIFKLNFYFLKFLKFLFVDY